MAETLLSPTGIKLFGRVVTDLQYVPGNYGPQMGANEFLKKQLSSSVQTSTCTITIGGTISLNDTISIECDSGATGHLPFTASYTFATAVSLRHAAKILAI